LRGKPILTHCHQARVPEHSLVDQPGASLDLVSVWSGNQGDVASPSPRWLGLPRNVAA
jgi:hypothetical protein